MKNKKDLERETLWNSEATKRKELIVRASERKNKIMFSLLPKNVLTLLMFIFA